MSDSQSPKSPSTPWHLWVVGVVSLFWNAGGAFDFIMTQTRNLSYMGGFSPEQLEFFYGIPMWAVIIWGIATLGSVLGSLLLLMRKSLASCVFLVSFVTMLISTIKNYILSDGIGIMGGGVVVILFSVAIFVISLLLYIYARAMSKRGVLR